jgi:hypothetical protein
MRRIGNFGAGVVKRDVCRITEKPWRYIWFGTKSILEIGASHCL